jgi:hypothetical protein
LVDDVLHEHGSGHRSHATWVWGKVFGYVDHVWVNVTEKLAGAIIVYVTGDANVENCGAIFDPVGLNEVSNTNGGNHDVGSLDDVMRVFGVRVNQGNSGVDAFSGHE